MRARRLLPLFLIAFALLGPITLARAGDPSFADFVKSLERDFNLKRTHIPMLWLAKGIVRVASPSGVSRLDLAIFEDQDLRELVAAPDLKERVDRMVGSGWMPFVDAWSRNGERTLLYVRPKGHNLEMIILTVEPTEAVAVLTRLNPDHLAEAIQDPQAFAFGGREQRRH
jgi:hypothetical protein